MIAHGNAAFSRAPINVCTCGRLEVHSAKVIRWPSTSHHGRLLTWGRSGAAIDRASWSLTAFEVVVSDVPTKSECDRKGGLIQPHEPRHFRCHEGGVRRRAGDLSAKKKCLASRTSDRSALRFR